MASVAKKPSGTKQPRAHTPYVELIKEAIVALKERTGSSQYAIAKFIEEKQKSHLPANFKKHLLVQLKKLVASGKLVKVKNSFKLAVVAKPAAAKKAPAKAPVKKVVAKARSVSVSTAKPKPKKAVAKKPNKAAKTSAVTSPGKKKVTKPAVVKVRKAPAKAVVKKPKSIKSPARKAPARKAKK
ncbi:winged-helix DNA-binding transcription factor family protein [Actinidia rufa]|uniref:Winged-helix DNA-binding transcription factor family protein n=1 Tax=Actinidia rufa TaxID=165716 RepID=A0A7J0GTI1_9ERIC|nr:winged-helix DNA-binding transcription factor family protein [Actinidia rufa]GFZ14207.1 winged-helix DNA-binding transcription factor family protein [Actinidia rufa]